MKKYLIRSVWLAFVLGAASVSAQDMAGTWSGKADLGAVSPAVRLPEITNQYVVPPSIIS